MGERVSMLVSTIPCSFSCCVSLGFEAFERMFAPSVEFTYICADVCMLTDVRLYDLRLDTPWFGNPEFVPTAMVAVNFHTPVWLSQEITFKLVRHYLSILASLSVSLLESLHLINPLW